MKNGRVYVGWCKTDITPDKKVLICGQFGPRISDEVVSPVTATVLALETKDSENGSIDQVIFVSCDLALIFFKEKLLDKLAGHLPDLNLDKITLCATHTHTAPGVERGLYPEPENDPDFMNPDEYRDFLLERLTEAIVNAWNSRKPGGISRGFDHAAVGHCRRAAYADGSALMYGDTSREDFIGLEGFEDHSVNMLFTWDDKNKLTGILVNLACPSQVNETGVYISADFWHEVRVELAERFNPDVYLLPQCAAAGDQSPHFLVNKKEESDMRQLRKLDEKQIIANKILFAVSSAIDAAAEKIESELIIKHEVKSFRLPLLLVTDEEYAEEKKMLEEGGKAWSFGLVCNLIERYEYQKETKERGFESHIIRIGDVVFATNSFELFTDYGICIKARSKAIQTFIVQLSDAVDFYLPTEKAIKGGHYSAIIKSNWVGPEGGRKFVDLSVDAISEVFPEHKEKSDPKK